MLRPASGPSGRRDPDCQGSSSPDCHGEQTIRGSFPTSCAVPVAQPWLGAERALLGEPSRRGGAGRTPTIDSSISHSCGEHPLGLPPPPAPCRALRPQHLLRGSLASPVGEAASDQITYLTHTLRDGED